MRAALPVARCLAGQCPRQRTRSAAQKPRQQAAGLRGGTHWARPTPQGPEAPRITGQREELRGTAEEPAWRGCQQAEPSVTQEGAGTCVWAELMQPGPRQWEQDDLPQCPSRTESGGPCSQSAQLSFLCVHQPGPQRVNVSSSGDGKGPTAPYMAPPA